MGKHFIPNENAAPSATPQTPRTNVALLFALQKANHHEVEEIIDIYQRETRAVWTDTLIELTSTERGVETALIAASILGNRRVVKYAANRILQSPTFSDYLKKTALETKQHFFPVKQKVYN